MTISGSVTAEMDKLVFAYSAKGARAQSTQATFYFKSEDGKFELLNILGT